MHKHITSKGRKGYFVEAQLLKRRRKDPSLHCHWETADQSPSQSFAGAGDNTSWRGQSQARGYSGATARKGKIILHFPFFFFSFFFPFLEISKDNYNVMRGNLPSNVLSKEKELKEDPPQEDEELVTK